MFDLVCKLNWLFIVICSFLINVEIFFFLQIIIFCPLSGLVVSLGSLCNNQKISSWDGNLL